MLVREESADGWVMMPWWSAKLKFCKYRTFFTSRRDAGNRGLSYSYTRGIPEYKQVCMHIFRQPRGAGSHCRFRSKTIAGMPQVVTWTLLQTPLREVPDITGTTCRKLHVLFLPDSSTHRVIIARFTHAKTLHVLSLKLVHAEKDEELLHQRLWNYLRLTPHILVPRDRNKFL